MDVYPQRNPNLSEPPASSEIGQGITAFVYGLEKRWKYYLCNDFVFIMYFKDANQVSDF